MNGNHWRVVACQPSHLIGTVMHTYVHLSTALSDIDYGNVMYTCSYTYKLYCQVHVFQVVCNSLLAIKADHNVLPSCKCRHFTLRSVLK